MDILKKYPNPLNDHLYIYFVFLELSLITLHWFLTVFSSVVHVRVLLRIWDLFFYEGSVVLFQVTLAMFKLKVSQMLNPLFSKTLEPGSYFLRI